MPKDDIWNCCHWKVEFFLCWKCEPISGNKCAFFKREDFTQNNCIADTMLPSVKTKHNCSARSTSISLNYFIWLRYLSIQGLNMLTLRQILKNEKSIRHWNFSGKGMASKKLMKGESVAPCKDNYYCLTLLSLIISYSIRIQELIFLLWL